MKVILSRKGFDSGSGEQPSPILSDGTLLSLPIPDDDAQNVAYKDIYYNGKSYYDIITELSPASPTMDYVTHCHLDPDIRDGVLQRAENWRALFGQSGIAQRVLDNAGVGVDDLFLFFGWFKQTEQDAAGHLRYKVKAPNLHVIFGYLQVGKIYRLDDDPLCLPDWARYHVHTQNKHKPNVIYEANEHLTFAAGLRGWGCLKFAAPLVLTKPGQTSKSVWQLPGFFKDLSVTGKGMDYYYDDAFHIAHRRGQEFVVEENEQVTKWAEDLVITNQ